LFTNTSYLGYTFSPKLIISDSLFASAKFTIIAPSNKAVYGEFWTYDSDNLFSFVISSLQFSVVYLSYKLYLFVYFLLIVLVPTISGYLVMYFIVCILIDFIFDSITRFSMFKK